MSKFRKAPTFTISGTIFEVDIEQQVLRQKHNPHNEISFISDMLNKGDHYRLFYDPKLKNKPRDTYDPKTLLEVQVPKLITLDPEGMSVKYGVPIAKLEGKTDFQIMVDYDLYERRKQDILPTINIAGEDFIIDLRRRELRAANDYQNWIDLKQIELSPDGEYYHFFFHEPTHQFVELQPKLVELPAGVVMVEIPNEIKLDPVGAARIYGIDEMELLRRFPIEKNLSGKLTPLADTWVQQRVEQNNRLLLEQKQNQRQQKQRVRPRF
jgi:hypothetical protein